MDFAHWTDAYLHLRQVFCGRCEDQCTDVRKLACIEMNLTIIEMAEVAEEWKSSR
jgi:hypothetical protein